MSALLRVNNACSSTPVTNTVVLDVITCLSARWSYLDVWVGTGDLAPADPYFLRPDLQAADAGICSYHSEPLYWLPASPARALTLATGWPQIGLPTAVTTMHLDPISQPGTPRRG